MRSAWSRHPWLGTMGAIAGLILFMSVVPIVPFKPSCLAVPGSWNSERVVKGTMTSEYQEQLNAGFRALGVYHWHIGNLILIRALPWFDGIEHFDQHDAVINAASKAAPNLAWHLIDEGEVTTSKNYRDPELTDYIRSFRESDGKWYKHMEECAFVQTVVTGRIPADKTISR